jgi:RNase H-fold protein (predicted Holliday junction resolvase)
MESEPSSVVLAIDPGSDKCGVAVVARSGAVLSRAIVPTSNLTETVRRLITEFLPIHVVCGKGTGSKPILRELEAASLQAPLSSVDESYTSEAARARFVAENPPKGLERLLPRSLRTPSVPYDDYVAVILAERYWRDVAAADR